MHQKHLELLRVVDNELKEAIGQDISGGLVRACRTHIRKLETEQHNERHKKWVLELTVTDAGLGDGAFKSSSNSGINTLRLAPLAFVDAVELLVLVTLEPFNALLNDLGLDERSNLSHYSVSKVKSNII